MVGEAIDGLAAALAAEMATPAETSNLEWINQEFDRAAEAGDLDALAETDLRFHEAIAAASHNALLINFVNHIHQLVRRFRTTTFAHPGRAEEAVAAHRALVQAIAEHDTERSRAIAMQDMAVARRTGSACCRRKARAQSMPLPRQEPDSGRMARPSAHSGKTVLHCLTKLEQYCIQRIPKIPKLV